MGVTMKNALVNREKLINAVKVEIIGPSEVHENSTQFHPHEEIVLSYDESQKNYYWNHCGIKEEVLQTDFPSRRYSAGMLYPMKSIQAELVKLDRVSPLENEEKITLNENLVEKDEKYLDSDATTETKAVSESDFLPTSLGLTSRVSKETKQMKVKFTGGIYNSHRVQIGDKKFFKNWWLRETISGEYTIDFTERDSDFKVSEPLLIYNLSSEKIDKINLTIDVKCRVSRGEKLVTVYITNRTNTRKEKGQADEVTVFQSEIKIELLDDTFFLNYPKHYQRSLPMNENQKKDELLYRNKINYAFGHGCAAQWNNNLKDIKEIKTTFLPTYETTSMTPDVKLSVQGEEKPLEIKMIDLATASNFEEIKGTLEPLIEGYRSWIEYQKDNEVPSLPKNLRKVASDNLDLCEESLERMIRGLDYLQDEKVRSGFILANKAMLLQQVNGKKLRTPYLTSLSLDYDITLKETVSTIQDLMDSKNKWRAFQMAFFLMSIESIVNEKSEEREIVDLIWFPTGGGKTEAYLAVAAFQMFYRRLIDSSDAGVDVIMRYTLRLLTTDQFQRSSRLICAMEYLREVEDIPLGDTPFSIGMWVGNKTSPNSNKEAISQMTEMNRGKRTEGFLLNRCPWCGSVLGKVKAKGAKPNSKSILFGFRSEEQRLVAYCPDSSCHFHKEIPVYFVDETIYQKRPTFLIGTIDKFVQLAWNPNVRSLFGLDLDGNQKVSPPNLIIQDELHLISGPLGTLSGLFESVIEELCTKFSNGKFIKPKIISATATIKEFQQQAKDLFAREEARIFPSPGLDIDDSFFAKVAVDKITQLPLPGRKYVGIFTSNVGLMMSEVQTFSAILQEANRWPKDECDPYWTLLAFYNSLRDLGAGINLCNMDIPTYMKSIARRENYVENRYIKEPLELTSRMQSHEIAQTIDNLKEEFDIKSKVKPLDVCLASNIIEVGVDIDRLSVMAVVGQPKTTAQYIQVTGRVGRRWEERPGVIFTIYSNRNSRDKSHFEHFIEYHQRLYAQVETTSVTPFSDASLERGLSAVVISFIRQRFSKFIASTPDSQEFAKLKETREYKHFKQSMVNRLKLIDIEQAEEFKSIFKRIEDTLLSGNFTSWKIEEGKQGLMYMSGDPVAKVNNPNALAVINSLRSVDAESRGKINSNIVNQVSSESDDDWGDFGL
ncbi:helicase-related protein [Planococcus wigleyi]|uniref:Helicase n=1 Tax=Planococcus wigleyi TaxID=2762216 RepID=A0ABR8WBT0_9BACL|nr:helicase-related protein [Planococcus wigleyi]MBD8014491.1 helicase [Planococcus wigleyi]